MITDLDELKFEPTDFDGQGVSALSDRPNDDGMTAQELKEWFDNLSTAVIAPRINDLLDELKAQGSSLIGTTPIQGVTGDTLPEQLQDMFTQMQEISQGAVPDGSITDAKLSPSGILASFAQHIVDYALHIKLVEVAGGTGSAYTISEAPASGLYVLRMPADCTSSATIAGLPILCNGTSPVEAGQIKSGGYYLFYCNLTNFRLINPETRSHTHPTSQITGLSSLLSGKANTVHSHATSQVTGLDSALANIQTQFAGLHRAIYGGGTPDASVGKNGDIYIKI